MLLLRVLRRVFMLKLLDKRVRVLAIGSLESPGVSVEDW